MMASDLKSMAVGWVSVARPKATEGEDQGSHGEGKGGWTELKAAN